MASKKHVDPLKAKQKRQKIIAAVLGVLFVGVLAFQVPRVMKMMKTPPNPHANDSVTTTTATGTPSLAAPTLRGAEQPATTDPTTGAPVAVSATPTVQDGQLASFSRFASKDPFNQQLSDDKSASPSSSSSGGVGSGSAGSGGTSSPPQIPSGSKPQPGQRGHLGERDALYRCDRERLPAGEPALPSRLRHGSLGEDLDRRRLVLHGRRDGHAEGEQARDAREHGGRHALHADPEAARHERAGRLDEQQRRQRHE